MFLQILSYLVSFYYSIRKCSYLDCFDIYMYGYHGNCHYTKKSNTSTYVCLFIFGFTIKFLSHIPKKIIRKFYERNFVCLKLQKMSLKLTVIMIQCNPFSYSNREVILLVLGIEGALGGRLFCNSSYIEFKLF